MYFNDFLVIVIKSKGFNIKFNYSNDENNVTKRIYECTKKINQKFTPIASAQLQKLFC